MGEVVVSEKRMIRKKLITKNTIAGEVPVYFNNAGQWSSNPIELIDISAKKLNSEAVYDFLLYRTVLPPNSIYEGVSALFPGEELWRDEQDQLLTLNPVYRELGKLREMTYSLDDFVEQLDRLLYEQIHREIDGKRVAVTLSGGIDSAILASYVPKDTLCVTWAGWGGRGTDLTLAQKSATALGLKNHQFCTYDFSHDAEIYTRVLPHVSAPFMFSAGVTYLRIGELLRREFFGKPYILMIGQNADTIAGAFDPTIYTYYFSKFAFVTRWFPIPKTFIYTHRKYHLMTSTNPLELVPFFQSSGLYPGEWIRIPDGYFERKLSALKKQIGHTPSRFTDFILMDELMTEARRNQFIQNIMPRMYDATVFAPFYREEVMRLMLQLPMRYRRINHFQKEILRRLALRRGVPREVVFATKKGLSYNYQAFFAEKRHIPIWDALETNATLNHFIDIHKVRKKYEENYFTMDLLRSLHEFLMAHQLSFGS